MRGQLAIALLLASTPAFAQHDHSHEEAPKGEAAASSSFGLGLSLVAATFDTRLYVGDYEGVVAHARWSSERFAVIVSGSAFRIEKNGGVDVGGGDLGVHGQAVLVSADSFDAGVIAGISLPTGSAVDGLGMGHAMLMPGVFGAWTIERVRLAASVGYSRALGEANHDHGAWPIVSPMLMAEISWNAGADLRLPHAFTAGARASGGLPAGEGGPARATAGARVAWQRGRVDTALELHAGLVGDPFGVRGVASAAVSF